MSEANTPFLPRVEYFMDCAGKERAFELSQGPQTDGVVVTAHEVDPPHAPGYEFSAWSSTIGDALGALRGKIREGISRRYLAEDPDRGLIMLTNKLRGIIEEDGITVDGRRMLYEQLLSELLTVQGWVIEIRITDPST